MSTDNSNFEALVLGDLPTSYDPARFPMVIENHRGDCVEVFSSDEPYNGDRIDGRVTVFRGVESGEIVGVQVKGMKTWIERVLRDFPGFILDIVDNNNQVSTRMNSTIASARRGDHSLVRFQCSKDTFDLEIDEVADSHGLARSELLRIEAWEYRGGKLVGIKNVKEFETDQEQ